MMKKLWRAAALSALALVGGTVGGCGSGQRAGAALTPEDRASFVESFDQVWSTVKRTHWDPEKVGPAWDAARDQIRPKVEAAATADEARDAMDELLGTLGQTHFGIIPREAYERAEGDGEPVREDASAGDEGASGGVAADGSKGGEAGESGGRRPGVQGWLGIELRAIEGSAVVFRVAPGSPAAAAGVKPGWELSRVDGRRVSRVLERLAERSAEKPAPAGESGEDLGAELMTGEVLGAILSGDAGETAELEFRDERDRRVRRTLTRVEAPGFKGDFGNLVGIRVRTESKRLPLPAGGVAGGEAGYFSLSIFAAPSEVMPLYNEAMASFADARGVVIDLRGNPGGIGAMAMGMGSWFITEGGAPKKLGTMTTRDGSINFVLNRRARPYAGKVAILIDGGSASTSEILAGGLKDLLGPQGRARVFGSRSAGAALPSQITRLPSGDGFQYAVANYVSIGGGRLEGVGVIPDEPTPLTRRALLEGKDPALDAALAWIAGGASGGGPSASTR